MALDFEAGRELRNKLLVLYTIYKAENPITYAELENIMLKLDIMDYMSMAETIGSLVDTQFVEVIEGRDFRLLMLTEQGTKALLSLDNKINTYHREEIDREMVSFLDDKRQKMFSSASYTKVAENATLVNMRLNEDFRELFNLTIRVGSNEEAEKMLKIWEDNAVDMFHAITKMFEID